MFNSFPQRKKDSGGAPKKSGDNVAAGSSISGTTLKLTPEFGQYDGVNAKVTITDADFLATNIKNGVDIFGLLGTFTDIQSASGSGTFTNNTNYVDITGLTFTPSIIITTHNYSAASSQYFWINVYILGNPIQNVTNWQYSQGSQHNKGSSGFSNITSSGFRFTDGSVGNWNGVDTQFRWYARK